MELGSQFLLLYLPMYRKFVWIIIVALAQYTSSETPRLLQGR